MDKLIKLVYFAALAIIVIISFFILVPVYTNLKKVRSNNEELKRKLEEKQAECLELRQLFNDLESNPKAVEKVAREKFGLCKRDEVIYIYKSKNGLDRQPAAEKK